MRIEASTRKHKKYVATLDDGSKVHFGDKRYQHFHDSTPLKKSLNTWITAMRKDEIVFMLALNIRQNTVLAGLLLNIYGNFRNATSSLISAGCE